MVLGLIKLRLSCRKVKSLALRIGLVFFSTSAKLYHGTGNVFLVCCMLVLFPDFSAISVVFAVLHLGGSELVRKMLI